MKKFTIRSIGAAALAGLLFFGGCSDTLDTDSPVQSSSSLGTLRVQIGGGDARTLIPTETFSKYALVFTNQATNKTVEDEITGTVYNKDLEPGKWTVKVTGYIGGNPSISGTSETITVETGVSTQQTVNIILKDPVDETALGTFSYGLTFPELASTSGYNATTLTLAPANPNKGTVTIDLLDAQQFKHTVTRAGGKYTVSGSENFPSGEYTMTLKLESNRNIISGGNNRATVYREETVYIYPGMTTRYPTDSTNTGEMAKVEFLEADFTQNLYLKGTVNLTSTGTGRVPTKVVLYASDGTTELKTAPVSRNGSDWNITVAADKIAQDVTTLNFRIYYGSGVRDYYTWSTSIANKHGSLSVDMTNLANITLAEPRNLQYTRTSDSVTLTWDPVPNAQGYRVYRTDRSISNYISVAVGTCTANDSTSVTDTGSYTYYVRAINWHNNTGNMSSSIYVHENGRSLSSNTWATNEMLITSTPQYYKFFATGGTIYRIQWDELGDSGAYTGGISVYYAEQGSSGYSYIGNSGYTTVQTINPINDGWVTIRVNRISNGTYAIRYLPN